jgi:hypothetical protein
LNIERRAKAANAEAYDRRIRKALELQAQKTSNHHLADLTQVPTAAKKISALITFKKQVTRKTLNVQSPAYPNSNMRKTKNNLSHNCDLS